MDDSQCLMGLFCRPEYFHSRPPLLPSLLSYPANVDGAFRFLGVYPLWSNRSTGRSGPKRPIVSFCITQFVFWVDRRRPSVWGTPRPPWCDCWSSPLFSSQAKVWTVPQSGTNIHQTAMTCTITWLIFQTPSFAIGCHPGVWIITLPVGESSQIRQNTDFRRVVPRCDALYCQQQQSHVHEFLMFLTSAHARSYRRPSSTEKYSCPRRRSSGGGGSGTSLLSWPTDDGGFK